MRVLGIETSCDETAAAILEVKPNEFRVLSSVVASQIDIHQAYGGVVPEVAARSHLEVILPVIGKSLEQAQTNWDQIDGLAVTNGPGLPGALLVGVNTAKALALAKNKLLVGVDHVHAHFYGAWLNLPASRQPSFPSLGLIISGGHTQLVLFSDHLRYRLLGQTLDDAVGEAFDKVAKMMGLGFPGGPAISQAAQKGRAGRFTLPIPKTKNKYDFSFSGLKTAVLRHLQDLVGQDYNFPSHQLADRLSPADIADTAWAFEQTAAQILASKLKAAASEFRPQSIVVGGGVAANQVLRTTLSAQLAIEIFYPPLEFCTDNAAMIAVLGAIKLAAGSTTTPFELETAPSLSM